MQKGEQLVKMFALRNNVMGCAGFSEQALENAQAEVHAIGKLNAQQCRVVVPKLKGLVVPFDQRKRVLTAIAREKKIELKEEQVRRYLTYLYTKCVEEGS